jgi:hypothetical protein
LDNEGQVSVSIEMPGKDQFLYYRAVAP